MIRPATTFLLPLLTLLAATASAQERVKDQIYLKQGGVAYTMDVFKPATPNHEGIVFIVSGGWFSSHEMINADFAKAFTDQGFTVFEVVHGSQPKYTLPEIVPQLHRALRFIHATASTYGVDPNKLGITGASAGGHLSLLLAGTADQGNASAKDPIDKEPDTVKAVVDFYGPTDFMNWGETGKPAFTIAGLAIFMPAFGVNPQTAPERLKQLDTMLAPIHFITPSFPPVLIVHGDADPLVPIQQSKILDAELTAKGVDHKFVSVPGGKHDAATLLAGLPDAIKWFSEHLK